MSNIIQKKIDSLSEEDHSSLYRLTYIDGRKEILSGKSFKEIHLISWKDKVRDIQVSHLQKYLEVPSCKKILYTPLEIVEFEKVEQPLHPYLMGVLLGDGGLSRNSTINITSADIEIINRCRDVLPYGVKFSDTTNRGITYFLTLDKSSGVTRSPIRKYINNIGLQVTSERKFIPSSFLKTSVEDRLELLKGLMDTDGTVDTRGTSSYSSSSKQLAEDVQNLVRSLGGIARIATKRPFFTYKGEKKEGLLSYRVNIRISCPRSIFSIPRKVERAPLENQYSKFLKLRLVSAERIYE